MQKPKNNGNNKSDIITESEPFSFRNMSFGKQNQKNNLSLQQSEDPNRKILEEI